MATVREYFAADFSREYNIGRDLTITTPSEVVVVATRVHLAFNAAAIYLSALVPPCADPAFIVRWLAANPDRLLSALGTVAMAVEVPGERPLSSTDLRFNGRFFVYVENDLSPEVLSRLTDEARPNGILLQVRGPTFASGRAALDRPLAFISHDSRDKDIAQPIAVGLSKLACRVWYDEYSLRVGQSLRESIERGIKECKKCVLVLSRNFFSNSGWTKTEFSSVFVRQIRDGRLIVLPVWRDVSKEDVYEYSPSLLDVVGVNWSLGEDEVVRRLFREITAPEQPER